MAQLSFEDFETEERFYTVSELTREIKFLLESTFQVVWVQGEISNFLRHSSGHMYFSLKDEHAQISCAMWRTYNQNLFFMPRDGMRVTLQGRVGVYEKRGSYQLSVLQLLPAGAGELQLAFEQLKERLHEEGLFDDQLKKPIPRYPERIGIVTSPTGAAVADIITVLRRRCPWIEIVLSPARVQGEGAASEIAAAIDRLNQFGEVDVMIVGRGGGSLEDMWAFNEEVVARAVAGSEVPVVSAVGHEVDFSICDLVADVRAPTPSAAAELVVQSREELRRSLNSNVQRMTDSIFEKIASNRERIRVLENSYALLRPLDMIMQLYQRLDENRRMLQQLVLHRLEISRSAVSGLGKRLALLEHQNVLKRGYSLVFRQEDRKLVKSSSDLKEKDTIEIGFFEGKVLGTVDEVLR